MAQPVDSGSSYPLFDHHHLNHQGSTYPAECGGGGGGRPPVFHNDYTEYDSDDSSLYSPRPQTWALGQRHDREGACPPVLRWSPPLEPEHQFFIIREGTPATPPPPRDLHLQPNTYSINHPNDHRQQPQYHHHHQQHYPSPPPNRDTNPFPGPVACFMERTHSGRTIVNAADLLHPSTTSTPLDPDFQDSDDTDAADRVEQHLATARGSIRRHERILRTLINPRSRNSAADPASGPDFKLDNAALESIFSAADALFFQGRLSRRVQWEWSHGAVHLAGVNSQAAPPQQGNPTPSSRIIGTTALRQAVAGGDGGYETLIVLSSPILTDTKYNRRLLISTFLHELIHSYLFIWCGFKARHCGGHTRGFRRIAEAIDRWEGQGSLRLGDVEADLEHFREEQPLRRSSLEGGDCAPICHHHHQGGVDPYDSPPAPWSTGPRVVFGAHEPGGEGRWSAGTPPSHASSPLSRAPSSMSTASTLVEKSGWGSYDGSDAVPRCMDVRGHAFPGALMQPYVLH